MSIRCFVLCCLCALASLPLAAQKEVKVSYEYMDKFQQGLLKMQGISYLKATVEGMDDKPFQLTRVVCRGGNFEAEEIIPEFYDIRGIKELHFYAQGISPDSVKVHIETNIMGVGPINTGVENSVNFILMETYDGTLGKIIESEAGDVVYVIYPYGAEIPLIAYTTGLESEMEIEGVVYPRVDFCGLRFKYENPRNWYEKLGVNNYIYYTIKFK